MHVHGRPYQQLPGVQSGRNHLQNIELTFLPEMEVVEVKTSNKPLIWIARDQVFSMEPEQEMASAALAGPDASVGEPEVPKAAPVPPEGLRDCYSAPVPVEPDLRPPPKDVSDRGMSKRLSHDTLTDDPPKESRFAKVGKKRGRPKKVK